MGLVIEGAVAVLLALTIGYCVVLNARLKRLHADRDTLRQMVADLVQATTLANSAIKELKATATEADAVLTERLSEAERFGAQLAGHVEAGSVVLERIAQITSVARRGGEGGLEAPEEPSRMQSALQKLAALPRAKGHAA